MSDEEILKRLYQAYLEARRHKMRTTDEVKFETHLVENLVQIKDDIVDRRYEPSRSIAFIVTEPKMREIFAAPFRDRVVHHFICDLIVPWWERHLLNCSYSCRKGKGTDAGKRDFYAKARKISQNFTIPIDVVKIDLQSYFCSIPREKLFQRVEWGLDRQFRRGVGGKRGEYIYYMLKFLVHQVIFDDPTEGVRIKGSWKDWEDYPRYKSLFFQVKGKGIVIGNYTSQVFSNIFLDVLDRFCVITLKEKGYGRYVDDAFFVIPQSRREEFFEVEMPMIRDFVDGMGLKLNEKKTLCQDFRHGVEFLGGFFGPNHVLPSARLKKNFRQILTEVVAGERDIDSLVATLGQLQHYDAGKLITKVFEENGQDYVYMEGKEPSSIFFREPKRWEG